MTSSSGNDSNSKPYPYGIVVLDSENSEDPPAQPSSSLDEQPSFSNSNPLTMMWEHRLFHHWVLTGGDPEEACYTLHEVIDHVLELVRDENLVDDDDDVIATEDNSLPRPSKRQKKEQGEREGHDRWACQ